MDQEFEEMLKIWGEIYSPGGKGTWTASLAFYCKSLLFVPD